MGYGHAVVCLACRCGVLRFGIRASFGFRPSGFGFSTPCLGSLEGLRNHCSLVAQGRQEVAPQGVSGGQPGPEQAVQQHGGQGQRE